MVLSDAVLFRVQCSVGLSQLSSVGPEHNTSLRTRPRADLAVFVGSEPELRQQPAEEEEEEEEETARV